MNMTAKESKAVAWQFRVHGYPWELRETLPVMLQPHVMEARALVPESALHAAEAELGELRRRVGELLTNRSRNRDLWKRQQYEGEGRDENNPNSFVRGLYIESCSIVDELKLLSSDGGADGDNEGEGK